MKLFRRNAQATTSLETRVLTALIAIPPLFAIIWIGEPWFAMLVAVVALWGLIEFYSLVSLRWERPFLLLGALWTAIFLLNALFGGTDTLPIVAAGAVALSLLLFPFRRRWKEDVVPWGWTMAGAFLLGWTLSYFVLLREIDYGREWVVLTLFSVFAVDTSAYFVGRAIGRHQLAPRLSPKKTWEGAIGGVAGALLISPLIDYSLDTPMGLGRVLGLGALIAVVSQVGDLLESFFKRSVGVKDAGGLVPGHGGVLDRLDSVVFTVVVVYYYIQWATG
ncbi:MAG: phosphatidate cytidylyltransferase [Dehalococcoidia bacterium]